jgi:DNA-binding CsgD family transcriptional regulator
MFNLGLLLAHRTESPDLDEARRWLERAAESGHTGAMFNLGLLLAHRTESPDLDEARRWWERAAESGNAEPGDTDALAAMTQLTRLLLQRGDVEQAEQWARRAADLSGPQLDDDVGYEPEPKLALELTRREHELLRLVAEELTNHEIAERLGISRTAVHRYWRRIMHKLSADTRAEAIARARELQLI